MSLITADEKKTSEEVVRDTHALRAYRNIPYALMVKEISGNTKDFQIEMNDVCDFYSMYKRGAIFMTEGSNGDYVSADLRFRLAASLIDKEARFLFASAPDILVKQKNNNLEMSEDIKNQIQNLNDLLQTVLDSNNFEDSLLKASKDCFIGKRVAALVNFNEEDGITISFLKSTNFVYETKLNNMNVLTKFVSFTEIAGAESNADKRIFRKRYTLENEEVYLQEDIFDGANRLVEEIFPKTKIDLDRIPAVVILNDGLTNDQNGESEMSFLGSFESWFSKLSNADIDSGRKSMNPIKYTIDMDSNSTADLRTSAGAFWDLSTDQNLDKPNPSVGSLESAMSYSASLGNTLNRIKRAAYEQIDMPDINLETMQGTITSGKALRAIYWSLIVRCEEKMKVWGPQLRALARIIIDGSFVYPEIAKRYVQENVMQIDYKVEVVQNTPLPEDETEEKTMDLAEVESCTMSKKAYMKKWRSLSDVEADAELEQIAKEREMIENAAFTMH